MIPIQALARKSFVRQRGDLVRKLRHFPERDLKSLPAESRIPHPKMNGVFQQRGRMGFESAALSGGLPDQLCFMLAPV
jgi:hypothetical protein